MAISPRSFQQFDRSADFVVARPFTYDSKNLAAGQLFDKSKANTRRLRQLYEQRFLLMKDPEDTPPVVPTKIPMPDFASMSRQGLQEWLKSQTGKAPHPRIGMDTLVARAKEHWSQNNGD